MRKFQNSQRKNEFVYINFLATRLIQWKYPVVYCFVLYCAVSRCWMPSFVIAFIHFYRNFRRSLQYLAFAIQHSPYPINFQFKFFNDGFSSFFHFYFVYKFFRAPFLIVYATARLIIDLQANTKDLCRLKSNTRHYLRICKVIQTRNEFWIQFLALCWIN